MSKKIVKGVNSYQQEFSEGERASIDIITCAVRDRDGEMVLPEGIDLTDYRKNPVVIWGHKYGDGLPVGKNIWIKYDKNKNGLVAKTQYAEHEFANEIYEYRKDFPLGISIGFIPKEWIDEDEYDEKVLKSYGLSLKDVEGVRRIYTKCSLLEYSLVTIPSVADATMLAINKGLISKEEAKEKDFPFINLESIELESEEKEVVETEIEEKEIELILEEKELEVEETEEKDESSDDIVEKNEVEEIVEKELEIEESESNEEEEIDPSIFLDEFGSFKEVKDFPKGSFELIKNVNFDEEGKIESIILSNDQEVFEEFDEIDALRDEVKSLIGEIESLRAKIISFEEKKEESNQEKEINLDELEVEEKEIANDDIVEIDVEQLAAVVKEVISELKEERKEKEIDLSQIAYDAVRKAKGEIF